MADTIHCLKCDATYSEQSPTVDVCPKCGNADRKQTVYLLPPLGFTAERFEEIKAYARKQLPDWLAGTREREYVGEFWDDDYELCFDCDEDDRDDVTIYLYHCNENGVDYDQCHEMTLTDVQEV